MSAMPMVLITGACGGMGRACCEQLGDSYRLALTDRDQHQLDQLASELRNKGVDIATAIACDITDKSSIEHVVDATITQGQLTHLMHTAGVSPSMNVGWEALYTVNLRASQLLVDAVLAKTDKPVIAVLISSIAVKFAPKDSPELDALLDDPLQADWLAKLGAISPATDDVWRQRYAYGCSKYGVVRLVKRMTSAFAKHGGRIVSIAPGFIDTPMGKLETQEGSPANELAAQIALGRLGQPEEIAAVVEFLFSDKASYVTGCDWAINGGIPH